MKQAKEEELLAQVISLQGQGCIFRDTRPTLLSNIRGRMREDPRSRGDYFKIVPVHRGLQVKYKAG